MQNTKRFILSGCLAASVIAGFAGCRTEDRSAGRYMDDRLTAHRVESNLNRDPVYKFPDVHVNVFDGVAQLSGFVDTHQQIRVAADRAARTDGVREVINDISIKPQFKLVPAGQQTNGKWQSNTGATGEPYGESSGRYEQQAAPIVTPNQASPATPSSTGNNKDWNKDKNSENNGSNQ